MAWVAGLGGAGQALRRALALVADEVALGAGRGRGEGLVRRRAPEVRAVRAPQRVADLEQQR